MSKVEKLIQEMCPEGIEFKALSEIFDMRNGYTPSKANEEYWNNGTINWFRMEDIRANGKRLNDSIQKITPEAVKKGVLFKANSIALSTSATIGEHALLEVDCLTNQRFTVFTLKKKFEFMVDMEFANYYFDIIDTWCRGHLNQGNFASVDMEALKKYEIPLPPIEIQQEIVRILDKFTKLETELQAELEARKKQYVAISDNIFDREIERRNITEIADTYIGLVTTMTKHYVSDGVPLIRNSDIKENRFQFSDMIYLDQEFADKNDSRKHQLKDIITVHTGDVGTSAIIEDELVGSLGFATIVTRIKDSRQFLPEYVCYYLNSADNKRNIARMIKSDRNNLNLKDFNRLMIPVYDIDTQRKIVEALSKFHEISVDTRMGLPAEIEARHKQYEYYRDKLFTFERKVV